MLRVGDIPNDHIMEIPFPDVTAAGATNYVAMWRAPFNVNVQSVSLVFTDAITGTNTNSANFNLDNVDRSTELANVDYAGGTNAAAGTAVALYAPAAGLNINSGQALWLERELVGAGGLATPYGLMVVTYRSRG